MRRMTDKKTLTLFAIIYVVVFAVMNMLVFFGSVTALCVRRLLSRL